jgi:hypothetical protein
MHVGQKPAMMARMWYGVQQATKAPKMMLIVFKAFLARFSDFCFPFFFRRNLSRLPMIFLKAAFCNEIKIRFKCIYGSSIKKIITFWKEVDLEINYKSFI